MFKVNYQAGGRFDPPFMPTKPVPFFNGKYLEVMFEEADGQVAPNGPMSFEYMWKVDFDVELIGFAIEVSPMERKDNWELYVDNDPIPIMESIHVKLLPQGMYFIAFIPVAKGKTIKFVYRNIQPMEMKVVTLDLQFLRDEDIEAPVFISIDPEGWEIMEDQELQLTAIATYADNSFQDITNSISIKWASDTRAIAGVGEFTGLVVGKNNGIATVTATYRGLTATSEIVVTDTPENPEDPEDPE